MAICDAEWDEDRGGRPDADNLIYISFPSGGEFYKATETIIPWRRCGGHNNNRHVTPSIYMSRSSYALRRYKTPQHSSPSTS